jgi:hypothetical protein
LIEEEQARMNFEDIKNHEVFKKVDWQSAVESTRRFPLSFCHDSHEPIARVRFKGFKHYKVEWSQRPLQTRGMFSSLFL